MVCETNTLLTTERHGHSAKPMRGSHISTKAACILIINAAKNCYLSICRPLNVATPRCTAYISIARAARFNLARRVPVWAGPSCAICSATTSSYNRRASACSPMCSG